MNSRPRPSSIATIGYCQNVLAIPSLSHRHDDGPHGIRGLLIDLSTGMPIHHGLMAWKDSYDAKVLGSQVTKSDIDNELKIARTISGPSIFLGYFFNHFGHFIHESLTRLAPCLDNGDDPTIAAAMKQPFYFSQWGKLDFADDEVFYTQIMKGLGLDVRLLSDIETPLYFEELYIPLQTGGMGYDYASHSESYGVDTLSLQRTTYQAFSLSLFEPDNSATFEKVYVSRSGLSPREGSFLNEELLEAILEKEGWSIFHPEDHPFSRQIHLYQNAQHLVFAEGSALYGLLFIRPDLENMPRDISVIFRRREGHWLVDYIKRLNPCLADLQGIDAIVVDGLLGDKPWNSFSVVDLEVICDALGCTSLPQPANAQLFDSCREHLRAIIQDADEPLLVDAIFKMALALSLPSRAILREKVSTGS